VLAGCSLAGFVMFAQVIGHHAGEIGNEKERDEAGRAGSIRRRRGGSGGCGRLGTTLQVPEHMWPADRAAFEEYWDSAVAEVRIDPAVRDYLCRVMMLEYLPRPFGVTLGPVNRFLTTGFLPPAFREQMQLNWTEGDQRQFDLLIGIIATVYRLLPAPVARFPFNASLQELRLRMMRDRLTLPRRRRRQTGPARPAA
jgi:ER-bound oxygenase mpaB/B'/Rubber oxygenase, catalytic domain